MKDDDLQIGNLKSTFALFACLASIAGKLLQIARQCLDTRDCVNAFAPLSGVGTTGIKEAQHPLLFAALNNADFSVAFPASRALPVSRGCSGENA
ncbi:hypothetical protein H3V53_23420 [Paraburkholderia bengalensis]|uniref:Uncharacterized protein n=1 Tax=Paraburkholderia bengalensis TaxID=2747562 RepID=A0ABU8IWM3_9BURK